MGNTKDSSKGRDENQSSGRKGTDKSENKSSGTSKTEKGKGSTKR